MTNEWDGVNYPGDEHKAVINLLSTKAQVKPATVRMGLNGGWVELYLPVSSTVRDASLPIGNS
jgi:hypothetical protein